MITNLLHIQPSELKFPTQLNKLSTCWLQLTNRTDHNVAFKVKTTHPRKYTVRPNVGIVSPGSTCVIKVGMQIQKELLHAAVPKDKFLIQSMIAPVDLNAEGITSEMFRKERGNSLEEQKLRVVFVTANPPSPIPEVSEEESSPEASELEKAENKNRINAIFDYALSSANELQDQSSEGPETDSEDEEQITLASDFAWEPEEPPSQDWDIVSKLIEERSLALLENQDLQHELVCLLTTMSCLALMVLFPFDFHIDFSCLGPWTIY